jgi:hypothetical protein
MRDRSVVGERVGLTAVRSVLRLAVSIAVVAAIAAQLQFLADNELLRTVNFFSFFTIDSNILAALVFVGLEFDGSSPVGWLARRCRGAATLYMTMTVVWLAYTVVRGNIVDWYPYPFLDPRDEVEHAAGSWPAVIITTAVLTVAVVVLGLGLAWLARRRTDGSPTNVSI